MSSGQSPEFFGRYQVLGVLGKGGFGTVHIGLDTQLQRKVAIKVPHRNLAEGETEPFLREARRLAQLKHPGIVTVFDVGVEGGRCYIISDLVDGTSLKDWLRDHRPTFPQAVDVVAAVADALSHAHAQGVIHRDVKPSNIMLTDDLRPILLDFGLATSDEDFASWTESVLGTPAYMSPERQSRKDVHRMDGRADIFSLGVILYQMLCGRRPFNAPDVYELMRQVREDEPQPPRQRNPRIPRELERICLKSMSKRIDDRYTTASDLAAELRAALAPPPVPAPDVAREDEPAAEPTLSVGTCSACLRSNPEDAAFCAGCGKALAPTAADHSERATASRAAAEEKPASSESSGPSTRSRPTTSSPSVPSSSSISSRLALREAERRQVTILHCNHNLGETVELFEVLEPGDRDLLLGRWATLCQEEFDRYQGTILSTSGPGLMVCFGYPLAFEDAAHRAVQAGLRLLKGSARLTAEFPRLKGAELATWVAIHTGAAVVGESVPDGGGEAVSILGEARSVAARLEPLAEPGTLIISETVHHLVQGFFECESLGRHTVKGLARPLELFRVLRKSPARTRIDAAGTSGLTPLIGRDLEVGLLQHRWQQAGEGIGQTVLLVGEAGIGKSRLVHIIKEHVGERTGDAGLPTVVEWRCSPFYQNSGLYPAIEFFERFLAPRPVDPPGLRLETLVGHLRSVGLDDPESISLLAEMLSIPRDEGLYPVPNLGPQRLKERTAETLIDWVRACAERQPLLFVVEDLHWVDASTLEVLGQLIEQTAADQLLSVMTTRPDFMPPWVGRMHLTQVTLNRLSRQQIAELIRRKSGIVVLPPSLVDQIVDRTDGVPLFVEEFTRMVLEAGILREREAEGEPSATSSSLVQAIPATLQDLLMARLDRMDSRREVVQIASVLGREFSLDLLRAVAPLEEAELHQELAKLVQAEILFPRGRAPHASYLFKHALIQEAAYQSLLKSRRQQFHRDIARVLEEQLPEKARREPELLAHHHTEAGQVREALAYWEKAGRRAIEHSAHPEAIAHVSQGLSLLPSLEESPARDLQEFHLQLLLGVAVMAVEGYAAPRLTSIHGRARDLCVKLGAKEPLFQVMWGIWAWSFIRDELEFGAGLAREITELASTLGDPGYRMEAHFAVGCNAFYRGEFLTSRKECEHGLALHTPERGRFHCGYTGQDSGVTNQCYSACSLWYQGYPDQALRRVARAVALGRELDHPFSHAFALYHDAFLEQQCRRALQTIEAAETLRRLAEEQGFPFWAALGVLTRGTGLLLQGDHAGAIPCLRDGLKSLRATGAGIVVPHFTLWLAEAYGRAGRFDEASATLDEAESLAHAGKELFNEAELHRIRAELLMARPGHDDPAIAAEAETCFGRALDTARRQRSRSLELRAATGLARLLHRQSRPAEARAILAPIYGGFTEGFDTSDLVDARALLDNLAGSVLPTDG